MPVCRSPQPPAGMPAGQGPATRLRWARALRPKVLLRPPKYPTNQQGSASSQDPAVNPLARSHIIEYVLLPVHDILQTFRPFSLIVGLSQGAVTVCCVSQHSAQQALEG